MVRDNLRSLTRMGGTPPRIPGQGLARGLVEWLNDPGDPKMRKLAVLVIEEVNELTRSAVATDKRVSGTWGGRLRRRVRIAQSPGSAVQDLPNKNFRFRYSTGPAQRWFARLFTLNWNLKKYKFSPHLDFPVADSSWRVAWKCKREDAAHIYMLVELAQTGCLVRVRRCRECDDWLYARLKHQVFCSERCRQKNFRSSGKGRAHRRRYMRDYMRTWREKNLDRTRKGGK